MTAVWIGLVCAVLVDLIIAASVVVAERGYLRRSGGAR